MCPSRARASGDLVIGAPDAELKVVRVRVMAYI